MEYLKKNKIKNKLDSIKYKKAHLCIRAAVINHAPKAVILVTRPSNKPSYPVIKDTK